MRIKIVGPIKLPDGYGEMTRRLTRSLILHGHNISVRSVLFQPTLPKTGTVNIVDIEKFIEDEWIAGNHKRRNDDCDVVIQCLTADNFPAHYVEGVFNIGYCMWETDKIPNHWVDLCNKMDLILTPSHFSKKTLVNSGVKNVEVLPIPFDDSNRNVEDNENLLHLIGDKYVFYSVFQWSERKNPDALLNAYYSAFSGNDKVVLILKTYINDDDQYNRYEIESRVKNKKNLLKREDNNFPKVICVTDKITEKHMAQLHKACHTYVAPVRGEGYGIPIFDAALAGNHIIATDNMSYKDFLDTYYYFKYQIYDFIPYKLDFVHNAPALYTPDQKWAEINQSELIRAMKKSYKDYQNGDYDHLSLQRYEWAEKLRISYSYNAIGDKFLSICNEKIGSRREISESHNTATTN